MYHENPAINDAVLTIINDSDGEFCGMTYRQRCDCADMLSCFVQAVEVYSSARRWITGHRRLTRSEIADAARFLQFYYQNHMRECQTV
jgi:hypothetical protein